jgi:hypothetical protein
MNAQEGSQRYQIRCQDCPRSEQITWLPLLWDAGTCDACATTSVSKHLSEYPGHRCEVLPCVAEEPKTTLTNRRGQ